MADEGKSSNRWHSVPGLLTATAGVLAALTGLISGLNQIGLLDRWKQPPPSAQPAANAAGGGAQVGGAPAGSAAVTGQEGGASARDASGQAATAVGPTIRPAAPSVSRTGTGTGAGTGVAPTPAAATGVARAPASTLATSTRPAGQLPAGTAIELAAATRVCSTSSSAGDRFRATVVIPVTGSGSVLVPAGSAAMLTVARADPPAFIGARAESLAVRGRWLRLRDAQTRVSQRQPVDGAAKKGRATGACIPAGGRMTVTLKSPLKLGPR